MRLSASAPVAWDDAALLARRESRLAVFPDLATLRWKLKLARLVLWLLQTRRATRSGMHIPQTLRIGCRSRRGRRRRIIRLLLLMPSPKLVQQTPLPTLRKQRRLLAHGTGAGGARARTRGPLGEIGDGAHGRRERRGEVIAP